MKTSTEMAQVSFNNATSGLHLAQINTIKHRAKQGEFEDAFYGSERDLEHMVSTGTLLADMGFKTEVVRDEDEDGEHQFELRISWKDDVSWASDIYHEVHRNAVFYNLYLNPTGGELLRNVALKIDQEAHCGRYRATVDIPPNTSEDVIEHTQAILNAKPLNYTCLVNPTRTEMSISW